MTMNGSMALRCEGRGPAAAEGKLGCILFIDVIQAAGSAV
jgi:hypothetical protein